MAVFTTAFLRPGITALALILSAGLATAQPTAQGDNSNQGTGGATPLNALGNDYEKTPGSSPSPPGAIPGATVSTTPAKYSADNVAKDAVPLAVNDLSLSDADKRAIVQAVAQDRSTTGSGSGGGPGTGAVVTPPVPGALLSDFFEMKEFPAELKDRMPMLENHAYVMLPDRVLLVNAPNRIVVSEIRK
jgi:hypothetical protein